MAIGQLISVKMKPDDMQRAEVQAFRCGSRPHETPLADWIKNHSAAQITGGCKVWLYRLDLRRQRFARGLPRELLHGQNKLH